MLKFNSNGLLIPNTNIISSVTELKQHFVDAIPSETRSANFEKYIRYSDALKKVVGENPLRQWINGSFVTRLANPHDIDLITFIDHNIITRLGHQLDDFGAKGAESIYGVDAYIMEMYPEDHEKYFFSKSDEAYWMDRFDKTRRDISGKKHPKGFLEIIY